MGDYLVPAIMMVGQMGGQYLQGSQQANRAKDAQKDAQRFYQQNSLPNEANVQAQATQNRGQLGQARLGAYSSLGKNMASRGFGSGSGLGIKAAGDIESAYLRGIGEQQTALTKFSNTRQFAPGGDAYGNSVPGGAENASGNIGNTLLGMYMMNKLIGKQPGAAPTTPGVAPYNPLSQPAYSGYEAPYPSWMMQ